VAFVLVVAVAIITEFDTISDAFARSPPRSSHLNVLVHNTTVRSPSPRP
jgi:hypothetical protein